MMILRRPLAISGLAVLERDAGTRIVNLPVSMSNPTTADVTFKFSTANGTATLPLDYVSVTNGSATIPAGLTSTTIPVRVNGDLLIEPTESFFVIISKPINAVLGNSVATVTILNDD
jgi:hypothetical protein